jgi:hypothetical protein
MTMLIIVAALTATAIWAITAPRSPHEPTGQEMIDLVVLGFVP